MLSSEFLAELRRATEAAWQKEINPHVYGFQFQPGTRWNPGLSEQQIASYEEVLGIGFPRDFKDFLAAMNGTDLPMLNTYGNCGEPHRQAVFVYSYPRDLETVRERIHRVQQYRYTLTKTMEEQGFELRASDGLVPIYGHHYVVCSSDLDKSVVLSIQDAEDAIVYGNSLQEYLERDLLGKSFATAS
jgi:hypothetical protein